MCLILTAFHKKILFKGIVREKNQKEKHFQGEFPYSI